jgi:hypothetical protein
MNSNKTCIKIGKAIKCKSATMSDAYNEGMNISWLEQA